MHYKLGREQLMKNLQCCMDTHFSTGLQHTKAWQEQAPLSSGEQVLWACLMVMSVVGLLAS
jgi:hypothetical protein